MKLWILQEAHPRAQPPFTVCLLLCHACQPSSLPCLLPLFMEERSGRVGVMQAHRDQEGTPGLGPQVVRLPEPLLSQAGALGTGVSAGRCHTGGGSLSPQGAFHLWL